MTRFSTRESLRLWSGFNQRRLDSLDTTTSRLVILIVRVKANLSLASIKTKPFETKSFFQGQIKLFSSNSDFCSLRGTFIICQVKRPSVRQLKVKKVLLHWYLQYMWRWLVANFFLLSVVPHSKLCYVKPIPSLPKIWNNPQARWFKVNNLWYQSNLGSGSGILFGPGLIQTRGDLTYNSSPRARKHPNQPVIYF